MYCVGPVRSETLLRPPSTPRHSPVQQARSGAIVTPSARCTPTMPSPPAMTASTPGLPSISEISEMNPSIGNHTSRVVSPRSNNTAPKVRLSASDIDTSVVSTPNCRFALVLAAHRGVAAHASAWAAACALRCAPMTLRYCRHLGVDTTLGLRSSTTLRGASPCRYVCQPTAAIERIEAMMAFDPETQIYVGNSDQ